MANQVGPPEPGCVQGICAIAGDQMLRALAGNEGLQDGRDLGLVLGDQDVFVLQGRVEGGLWQLAPNLCTGGLRNALP